MHEVPKIVRQRMQSQQAPATPHPDADLLTAFAEKSVSPRERESMLAHLAVCADCRDVLSLSMPELETTVSSRQPAARFTWPVLRWGALAACVVLVGAAVTLQFRHDKSAPARQVAAEPAPQTPAAPAVEAPVESKAILRDEPRKFKVSASFAKKRDELNARTHLAAAAKVMPPAAAEQKVAVESEGGVAAAAAPAPVPSLTDQMQIAKSQPAEERVDVPVSRAKDASNAAEAPAGAVGGVASAAKSSLHANFAVGTLQRDSVPRWSLSSEGILQRSLDGGKTWQTVLVASAHFRALTALGPNIWVGGDAGALYHSADAGQHWMQVRPSAAGNTLNADVIAIEFTDTRHGKITTSGGQVWTTPDAGLSWALQ